MNDQAFEGDRGAQAWLQSSGSMIVSPHYGRHANRMTQSYERVFHFCHEDGRYELCEDEAPEGQGFQA